MKKYLDGSGLKNVLQRIKGKLDLKADKDELAIQSNPNLLDNWYFVNPINQRGQAEYTAAGHTIDRWKVNKLATTTVLENSIKVFADAIETIFYQSVDSPRLIADIYTFSVLYQSNNVIRLYGYKEFALSGYKDFPACDIPQIASIQMEIPDSSIHLNVAIQTRLPSTTIKLYAAKLELGDHQTLAHKEGDIWVLNDPPPDLATELAKCQRYYQIFATETLRPTNAEDFRPTMRIKPTLGTIEVNGKTYYTADANL